MDSKGINKMTWHDTTQQWDLNKIVYNASRKSGLTDNSTVAETSQTRHHDTLVYNIFLATNWSELAMD
jgi:hypothetical protein